MIPEHDPIRHDLLGDIQILLPGVPCKTSRGWLGYCSIVLLRVNGSLTLFDTGHFSDRALLLDMLAHIGLTPLDIKQIIVSHLHFDHILNVPLFRHATLIVSKDEVDYAASVVAGKAEDPSVPENWRALLNGHGIELISEPVELDSRTEIVSFPGHTPGGLVLFRKEADTVAICGDVIKNAWDAVNGKPGAAGVDDKAAARSIRHVLERARIIVPGHDRPFCLEGESLAFLSPFSWEVRGSILPGPQDEVLLDIGLAAQTVKTGLRH
ncbi:MAG: MBL fold metallo-hydrolase [Desulfobacteraceae bacterium]|nr:MBL fold metallo-hydrolase [Desulfobacteraceae bacterium]